MRAHRLRPGAIGNARPVVVFDVLARLLRRLYPRLTYVRNVTDVDDKINARAHASGEPIGAITARTLADYHADMAALGALPPDIEPRATAHIAEMVTLIERLIVSGHAYAADGHVLFAVGSFPGYGRLSGRSPDELVAGARVDVAPYKRDAGDFVLWKPSAGDLPGCDSPWGRGRPGWHIECSAMSWRASRWGGKNEHRAIRSQYTSTRRLSRWSTAVPATMPKSTAGTP